MNMDDVPDVYPCPRRQNHDDKSVDRVEVVCDGRTHVNIAYKGDVEVSRSAAHDCDRWAGQAQRLCQSTQRP